MTSDVTHQYSVLGPVLEQDAGNRRFNLSKLGQHSKGSPLKSKTNLAIIAGTQHSALRKFYRRMSAPARPIAIPWRLAISSLTTAQWRAGHPPSIQRPRTRSRASK